MGLLLDTHTLLWWVEDDKRLSKKARSAIIAHDCFVSIASAWELSIKANLGKIKLSKPVAEFFEEHVIGNGFEILPIRLNAIAELEKLKRHSHGDPFDRMLVVQSQLESLPIVSCDSSFAQYKVKLVW